MPETGYLEPVLAMPANLLFTLSVLVFLPLNYLQFLYFHVSAKNLSRLSNQLDPTWALYRLQVTFVIRSDHILIPQISKTPTWMKRSLMSTIFTEKSIPFHLCSPLCYLYSLIYIKKLQKKFLNQRTTLVRKENGSHSNRNSISKSYTNTICSIRFTAEAAVI